MLTLNIVRKPHLPILPIVPVDQSWSIQRIAVDAKPPSWEAVFTDALPELTDVSTVLSEDEKTHGSYYPLKHNIFSAFHQTPLKSVKIVILAQDPYHQSVVINGVSVPRAIGTALSVSQEDSIPSSLQNVYNECANSIKGFVKPDHGDLSEWSKQGVLLINTCLTVRPGHPASHGDIWLGFMNKVFKAIAIENPYCIYMLWGKEAQKLKPILGERSVILEAAHPSGLSANRGFFGCNHFNLANNILIRQNKVGINWRISTLAEFKRTLIKVTLPPSANHMFHQPKYAPVDVSILPPTIISRNQQIGIVHNDKIVTLLPIIPNTSGENNATKKLSPKNVPKIPNINYGNGFITQLPVIPSVIV